MYGIRESLAQFDTQIKSRVLLRRFTRSTMHKKLHIVSRKKA